MKSRFLFLLGLVICTQTLFAQESIIAEMDNQLLQKYILMAKLNYPRKKVFDATEAKAKSTLNAAQLSWLDIFNASYIYSPQTQKGTIGVVGNTTIGTNQIVTQGLMAGVSVNLGNILAKPSLIKNAKADYEIAKANSIEYDATLTNEVKSRYYNFLLAKKNLQIRNMASQNYKGIMSDVKLKYERAEIPIDAYTTSRNAATEAEASVLTAEVAYLVAKNALEEIIGSKLENVN